MQHRRKKNLFRGVVSVCNLMGAPTDTDADTPPLHTHIPAPSQIPTDADTHSHNAALPSVLPFLLSVYTLIAYEVSIGILYICVCARVMKKPRERRCHHCITALSTLTKQHASSTRLGRLMCLLRSTYSIKVST